MMNNPYRKIAFSALAMSHPRLHAAYDEGWRAALNCILSSFTSHDAEEALEKKALERDDLEALEARVTLLEGGGRPYVSPTMRAIWKPSTSPRSGHRRAPLRQPAGGS